MTHAVKQILDRSARTGRKVIIHTTRDLCLFNAADQWFTAMLKCAHCRFRWIAVWDPGMQSLTCPDCKSQTRIRMVKK